MPSSILKGMLLPTAPHIDMTSVIRTTLSDRALVQSNELQNSASATKEGNNIVARRTPSEQFAKLPPNPLRQQRAASSNDPRTMPSDNGLNEQLEQLRVGPRTLQSLEDSRHHRSRFVGTRPAYLATQAQVERIGRQTIDPPPPRRYVGFDRVCRSLRHIATAIQYGMIARTGRDPIEVQVSVIGDRLHISSNFHSRDIPAALRHALTTPIPDHPARPRDRKNKVDVATARVRRHLELLKQDFLGGDAAFATLLQKASKEISQGLGMPSGSNLGTPQVLAQAHAALHTLRAALQDAAGNTPSFAAMAIHHPPRDKHLTRALPAMVSQTMHAEQCIADDLARAEHEIYHAAIAHLNLSPGDHVVVPMAGKYVPCATCHEVESQTQRDRGLFDPDNARFVLHRASTRVGMAFWNEAQHIATKALDADKSRATAKAIAIRDRFVDAPEHLQTHGRDMVINYSFDTDSDDSASEK